MQYLFLHFQRHHLSMLYTYDATSQVLLNKRRGRRIFIGRRVLLLMLTAMKAYPVNYALDKVAANCTTFRWNPNNGAARVGSSSVAVNSDVGFRFSCTVEVPGETSSSSELVPPMSSQGRLFAGLVWQALTLRYRTVGVAYRLAARSETCDNAQLSEPCNCWPVAAGVSSGH